VNVCPQDVDDLRRRVSEGWQPEFVFFWSLEPARHGILGSECLSQWYPAPFVVDDVKFATAEHYMMWSKARLFGDDASAAEILADPNPEVAKRLGRRVRSFVATKWYEHRFDIVLRASVAKFTQNVQLREFLLGTSARVLAEASPTDLVWGIGLEAGDDRAKNPRQWRGLNLLGFALMRARAQLTSGRSPSSPVQR
jgi:ribA/ribD-fused uncharacterized protein